MLHDEQWEARERWRAERNRKRKAEDAEKAARKRGSSTGPFREVIAEVGAPLIGFLIRLAMFLAVAGLGIDFLKSNGLLPSDVHPGLVRHGYWLLLGTATGAILIAAFGLVGVVTHALLFLLYALASAPLEFFRDLRSFWKDLLSRLMPKEKKKN